MARLRWNQGGEAEITVLDGDRIQLWSDVAAAPGSRLDTALPSGTPIRVKVQRCRRTDTGFAIEGRLIDTTREARHEIVALLPERSE